VLRIRSTTRKAGGHRGFGVALATCAAVALGAAGAAFGLQAIALPRPTEGQLIAAKSLRWLVRQRAIASTGPARRQALCVNATVTVGPARRRTRASLLITRAGSWIQTRDATYRLGRTLAEVDGPWVPLAAARAGCPRVLVRRIGRVLETRRQIRAVRVGRPLLLEFTGLRHRLRLLVSADTFAPFAVQVGARGSWHHLAPTPPA
jgi:hypothetical protein